jgi:hypothetical protein
MTWRIPVSDWAALISSIAAAIGLLFTGTQVWLARRQDQHNRRIATEGVSVSWQVVEAPDRPTGEGDAEWLYRIVIQNPGPLPVDEVTAIIKLADTVRRVRYTGRLGEPTTDLTFRAPVLSAGGQHEWKRRLQVPLAQGAPLKGAVAQLDYRDMEMRQRSTTWPRQTTVVTR